jgi:hypothetical protein
MANAARVSQRTDSQLIGKIGVLAAWLEWAGCTHCFAKGQVFAAHDFFPL